MPIAIQLKRFATIHIRYSSRWRTAPEDERYASVQVPVATVLTFAAFLATNPAVMEIRLGDGWTWEREHW